MATFYNQATLSYGNVVRSSNITEGEIVSAATLTKTAVTEGYGAGDGITYVISLANNGDVDIVGVSISDDLGAYTVGTTTVAPLDYVDGSILYYQNGVLQPTPTVTAADALVIDGITIPAGGNAMIIYEAQTNEFAPLAQGATITNTAITNSTCEALTASATVTARDEVQLSIAKAISPAVVTCNGEIEYTFIVQNNGNTAAVATDNVIIRDIFAPPLTDITVTLNGAPLTAGTDYTYDETTGEFSTLAGAITVPAATYATAPDGTVIATPGVATLVVSGTI